MFTERIRYILKLLLYLSDQPQDQYQKMGDLAEILAIPKGYLNKVVPELVKLDYIESKKGVGGGICLEPPADQLLVKDVLEDIGALTHKDEDSYEACCVPELFTDCMVDEWIDDFKTKILQDTTFEELTDDLR